MLIPCFRLVGKAPPPGTTVELTQIDVCTQMLVMYKKQQQEEFKIEHSRLSMALGLNRHL